MLAGLRAQGCSYPFAHAPLTTRTPDCRLQTSSPTFRPLLSILCSIYYHRTSTDVALACPPHWNRNYTKTEISIFIFIFFFLRFLSLVYYFMSSIWNKVWQRTYIWWDNEWWLCSKQHKFPIVFIVTSKVGSAPLYPPYTSTSWINLFLWSPMTRDRHQWPQVKMLMLIPKSWKRRTGK